jgi:hypothetical protein
MTRSKQDTVVILIKDGDTDFTTAWSASDDGGPGQFAGPLRTIARAAAEAQVDVEVFPGELWRADDRTADGALASIVHAAGDRTWYLDRGPGSLVARLLGVSATEVA